MKRLFDILVAGIGGILLLPVMLAVALAVRVTSRGPVLYIQDRVGRYGRLFPCMKFRTMRVGGEVDGSITTSSDERVTRVGRWLRRWKLDELPQLWNVFVGRMSFVGPRPDVPGYADRLEGEARQILELRPGITGPASLFFRDEESLLAKADDPQSYNNDVIWPVKVRLNLEYARTRTFWKDIGYILVTVIPALDRWLKLVPRD